MLATIKDFLAQKRIAVVGVSRNPRDFNTLLFRDLRKAGYDAVAVNPHVKEIDGVRCYERVQAISPPVDGVLIMTKPEVTPTIVQDCLEAGVKRVWMYRMGGPGAVNQTATEFCQKHGIQVVEGGCPYMFMPGSAWFHRLHGVVLKIIGKYPK